MLKIYFGHINGLLKKNYKLSRDEEKRNEQKVMQTRNFFYPMHKQKILLRRKSFQKIKTSKPVYLLKKRFIFLGLSITNKEIDI